MIKIYKYELYPLILIIYLVLTSCAAQTEKEFYDSGRISYEVQIKDGQIHGKAIKYYENGSIMQISHWVKGVKQGLTTMFFKNGSCKAEINFNDGKQDGRLITWDSLGVLESIGEFKKGKNISYEEFYKNGNIKLKHVYKGHQIPFVYEYHENGNISKIYLKENENVIYYKAFDSAGKIYDAKLPIVINKLDKDENSKVIRLSLEHTVYDSVRVGVIFGNLDHKNQLVDTIDIVASKGKNVDFDLSKLKSGISEITGLLFEIEEPEEMIRGVYHFRYKF